MEQTTIQPHYLDYYSDWLIAYKKASTYSHMADVYLKGNAFMVKIQSVRAEGRIPETLYSNYEKEVITKTNELNNTFLN